MKNGKRPVKRYTVYIFLGFVFACLILAAVFLPRIVYGIYDDYQFNLSSKADRNLNDTLQLNTIYEQDCSKRLADYAWGLNSGKNYITTETEIVDDEELDSTIKSLIRELNKQLFQTYTDVEEVEEVIASNKAVDAFLFYSIGDFIPFSEELFYADSNYVYSCVDKNDCRRFMIYDESMSDGIAFSLLYMTIDMGTDFKVELIGDTYDFTIYYVKFIYPENFLSGYYLTDVNNIFYECFLGIMSEYYSADESSISSETSFFESENSVSSSVSLPFESNDLTVEIRRWNNGKSDMITDLGVGIRELAEAVGVMDIN